MSRSAPTFVTDFDGTLVTRDIGDEIAKRFLPGGAEALAVYEAELMAGRQSLVGMQRAVWPEVRCSAPQLLAFVDEVMVPRDGAIETLEALARSGRRVVVASAGFELYVARFLARLGPLARRVEVKANELVPSATGCAVAFPWQAGADPDAPSPNKGSVLDEARAEGARVVFSGDGTSDREAIGRADRMFCVAGSRLERWCRQRGAEHAPFSDFRELWAALELS